MIPLRRRDGPAIAVAVAVLVTSLVPLSGGGTSPLPFGLGLTTLGHLAGYAGLTVALAWGRRLERVGPLVAVVALAVTFGVGVELLQSLVPTRLPSLADAVVNGVGATTAAVVWYGRSNAA